MAHGIGVSRNGGKEKYGSLMIGLSAQFSLKNDQYLKTIIKATNVLSNHRLDNEGTKKAQSDDKRLNTTNTSASASNSTSRNSSAREHLELSLAQLEGCCYCCGKRGHKSRVFT